MASYITKTKTVFFAIGCFLLLGLGSSWQLNFYDEGLILTGAMRVMAGDVVHRDFYANYAPGQFHFLAVLFRMFGPSVGLERIADALVRCLILGLVYVLARRRLQARSLVLLLVAVTIWLAAWGTHSFPVWWCLALLLAAACCMLAAQSSPQRRRLLFAAGLFTGLIACFRYDVAVYVAIALTLFVSARKIQIGLGQRAGTFKALDGDLLMFACGILLVVLPLLAVAQVDGALDDLYFQVVEFPRKYYLATRSLPFPRPWRLYELIVYVPAAVVLCAGYWYFKLLRARAQSGVISEKVAPSAASDAALLFAILAACLIAKGLVRISAVHMALATVPALISLAMLWESSRGGREWHDSTVFRNYLIVCLTMALLSTLSAAGHVRKSLVSNSTTVIHSLTEPAGKSQQNMSDNQPVSVASVTGRVLDRYITMDRDSAAAIIFIRQVSRHDESIFVGTGRHDKIFVNDVAFYFLAQRQPATKWHHFDPGLQNNRSIQQQMIREIQEKAVEWIVLTSAWDDITESNDSAKSSHVFDLDQFIRNNYEVVKHFGSYSVWRRRSAT